MSCECDSKVPEMINASRDSRTIFTIGHGALDLGDYIDLIKTFGIDLIVDVRSSPYSRYVPHFNRESLEDALRIRGVEYRFAGEYLGGRPTEAEFFKSGEVPTGPKPNYLQLVDYSAMQETD